MSQSTYWSTSTREFGCLLQIVPLLIVPFAGIVQSCRYLATGPPDLFDVSSRGEKVSSSIFLIPSEAKHDPKPALTFFCFSDLPADPDVVPAGDRDPQTAGERGRGHRGRGGRQRDGRRGADRRSAAQVHAAAVVFHGHGSKVSTSHRFSNGLRERLTRACSSLILLLLFTVSLFYRFDAVRTIQCHEEKERKFKKKVVFLRSFSLYIVIIFLYLVVNVAVLCFRHVRRNARLNRAINTSRLLYCIIVYYYA